MVPLAASTFRTAKSIFRLQAETRPSATVGKSITIVRAVSALRTVRCPFVVLQLGPAIGAAWDSGSGRINIIIENSTVTAKGGNLRTDGNYVPGIGKNALGRAPEIGIQILNSTVDSFRLTEKEGHRLCL